MGAALRVEGVERIAVLRANALGDYVFALPALDALRATYPEAHITLLGRAWHAAFLPGRPGPIDEVVAIPGDGLSGTAAGEPFGAHPWDAASSADRERFRDEMGARRFDLAIQLHGGGRNSNPFVASLGARVTAGLRTPDAPALDRWIPYVYEQQETARCLEVVGLVGAAPIALAPRLDVTDADRHAAREALPAGIGPYAVLHPGASDPRRRWPVDRFASLADRLQAEGLTVVASGSPDEAELGSAIAVGSSGRAVDLVGRTTLSALVGILAGAALVVSNDTGPMHVAIAVGTPTVGIYWIGNLVNGGPLTRATHRPIVSWRRACPVCGVDCIRDACPHQDSFVDEPSVDEVMTAARELLAAANLAGRGTAGAPDASLTNFALGVTMTTTPTTTSMSGGTQGATGEHPLAEAGQEVSQSASQVVDRATTMGFQRADQGKQQLAEGLGQLAGSMRRVSTDMESEQPTIANVATTAADQTERIANYLRDTDARDLLHTVEDVARRQPLLFLGGAFLLGAAASRFLKAGAGGSMQSSRDQWNTTRNGYRSGYGTTYRTGSTYDTGYRTGGTEAYRATGPGAITGVNGAPADQGL